MFAEMVLHLLTRIHRVEKPVLAYVLFTFALALSRLLRCAVTVNWLLKTETGFTDNCLHLGEKIIMLEQ